MNQDVLNVTFWILVSSRAPMKVREAALRLQQAAMVHIGKVATPYAIKEVCSCLWREGKRVLAIQCLRKATGCSILEAKGGLEAEFDSKV